MRRILIPGVIALVCTASLVVAAENDRVPVRVGEAIPQTTPRQAQLPVNILDGEPVPVGVDSPMDSRIQGAVHPVESTIGLVPVDEYATPLGYGADKSGQVPLVMNDFFIVATNGTLQVSAGAGLLSNDFDLEGDNLVVNLITDTVDHGSLSVFADGRFNYTPSSGYFGVDFFDYRITDGTNSQESGRVYLEVVAVDRPPVAQNEFYRLAAGETLQIPAANGLLANDFDPDGDSVSVTLITRSTAHGALSVFAGGNFNFVPNQGFSGTDSFDYRISANGKNASATATIVVYEVNRSPIAMQDHYYVPLNGSLSIPAVAGLLRNDFDPDGDSTVVNLISNNVDHGSVSVFGSGTFSYTPTAGYSGLDSFTYRMADSNGANSSTTVTIFVGVTEGQFAPVPPPADTTRFGMSLPAPNPFNPTTKIDFRIDGSARTALRVYDVRGSLVRTLVDEHLPAGDHTVQWDGRDDRGAPVASGTYFAALSSGSKTASQRVALVK